MTLEHIPAHRHPQPRRSLQRADLRRAAMLLAAASIPVGAAVPAHAAPAPTPPQSPEGARAATGRVAPMAPSTTTRYVDVAVANVRQGPGIEHPVVGTVNRGIRLTGTLINGWLKIGDGRYVGTSILTSSAPTGATTTSGAESGSTVTRYVTATVGNVRSGPGLNHQVTGTVRHDAQVSGTLTSNGWLKMSGDRYLSGVILTSTPQHSSGSTAPAIGSTVTRYVTATSGNLRSGPGLGNPVVGTLGKDTKVTGTLTSNGWLKMSGDRYISGVILTSTAPGRDDDGASRAGAREVTRYVTASAGNVRSGPGTSYAVVGTLARDTKVTGALEASGWLSLGADRYISSVILTSSAPGTTSPEPSTPGGSAAGAEILRIAEQYTGIMYRWGGTTPAGFDCSGYIGFVFAQAGISLPRTAEQQRQATTPVTDPQPGDLVFWGAPAYHNAIYAGNGYIYDSGRAGLPTQKRRMFSGVTSYGRVG